MLPDCLVVHLLLCVIKLVFLFFLETVSSEGEEDVTERNQSNEINQELSSKSVVDKY